MPIVWLCPLKIPEGLLLGEWRYVSFFQCGLKYLVSKETFDRASVQEFVGHWGGRGRRASEFLTNPETCHVLHWHSCLIWMRLRSVNEIRILYISTVPTNQPWTRRKTCLIQSFLTLGYRTQPPSLIKTIPIKLNFSCNKLTILIVSKFHKILFYYNLF